MNDNVISLHNRKNKAKEKTESADKSIIANEPESFTDIEKANRAKADRIVKDRLKANEKVKREYNLKR